MKLIKRSETKSTLFSNKEAQYVAHQLLLSRNPTCDYFWSNNPKRFNKIKGWEDVPHEESYSTPFRAAMCFLKSKFNEVDRLRKRVKSLKNTVNEMEKEKRDKEGQEQQKIEEKKERNLRNAYCGLKY
jgi:hypothetical protein